MSPDITTTTTEETDAAPPSLITAAPSSAPALGKNRAKDGPRPAPDPERVAQVAANAPLTRVSLDESMSLKDVLDQLGPQGSYSIAIKRTSPQTVAVDGRDIQIGGFIETVDEPIDESWLKQRHGGGKYELTFKRNQGGKMVYANHRTVTIAGEPNPNSVPRASKPAVAPVAPGPAAADPIIMKAIEMMSDNSRRAEDRAERAGKSGDGDSQTFKLMQQMLADSQRAQEALRDQISALMTARAQPTTEDKVTNSVLNKLLDNDSTRVTQLTALHDSEIRQLRESMLEQERRLRDQADRDRSEMRSSHEREITMLRSSNEQMLASIRQSQEIAISSHRLSTDMQIKLLESETKRLRDANSDLADEVKDLRAKKDKSPIELAKDFNAMRDAFGAEDGGGKTSAFDKIAEMVTNPDVIGAVLSRVNAPPAAPAAIPVPQRRVPPRRQVARDRRTGQKVMVEPDGTITPIVTPTREGGEIGALASPIAPAAPVMPVIAPAELADALKFLESAFDGSQDPITVSRMAATFAPPDLIQAIRDHGVDQVMAKVAHLPSTSSLSTIAGRKWLRSLGKALVGEE